MFSPEEIDFNLLKKYSRPGPRYTSYPTAPFFNKGFSSKDFEQELLRTNASPDRSISLYFHIPFCDTLCYFCGCTTVVTHERQRISEYLNYLEKEMERISRVVNPERPVTQLHWGGGTPTFLSPEEIRRLGGLIREKFLNFDQAIEAGCEIDPRGLTREHLVVLKEAGFNRVSMGVQDFDPTVQSAINRIQPRLITQNSLEWARELGFQSLNLDLIYGLPFQTFESFEKTLDQIIELNPDRLAIFNYAHVPWLKKHQILIQEKDLPTPDQKLMILRMMIEKLRQAGYQYIGMDHFAKPEDELAKAQQAKTLYRNFQGYSTKSGSDVYAMGMSAISQFENIYAQNAKTLPEYYRAISEERFATQVGYRLTPDDHLRKEVITRLMCDFELDESEIGEKFGVIFDEYFDAELKKLEPLIEDGLLTRISIFPPFSDPSSTSSPQRLPPLGVPKKWNISWGEPGERGSSRKKLIVSPIGRLLIRNIVMNFDAYLDAVSKEKPVYSKTI